MLRNVSLLLSHTQRGLNLSHITKTHIRVPVMMARCKENGFGVCDFHLCGSVCGFFYFFLDGGSLVEVCGGVCLARVMFI